jgi:peptidyl-prolyl cis-trans isomerase B (cyclophilin B)
MRKIALLALSLAFIISIHAQTKTTTAKPKPKTPTHVASGRLVELKTDYGTMVIRLYDSTPLHRDNFIKLVKQGFYDSLLFHRVIKDFMIQGGDPTSKDADSTAMLGNGEGPGDMIPAEFRSDLIHKKGALAMARTDNPAKASSNCQFYIVQGKVTGDTLLNQIECSIRQNSDMGFYYTDAQRNTYKAIGGTPFLDQNYTVFGEVIKGLDVIDKIADAQTGANDRPVKDIRMKMRMLN